MIVMWHKYFEQQWHQHYSRIYHDSSCDQKVQIGSLKKSKSAIGDVKGFLNVFKKYSHWSIFWYILISIVLFVPLL